MENNFIITEEQKEMICEIFRKNMNDCEEWEICEMLDKIIDSAYENRQ